MGSGLSIDRITDRITRKPDPRGQLQRSAVLC